MLLSLSRRHMPLAFACASMATTWNLRPDRTTAVGGARSPVSSQSRYPEAALPADDGWSPVDWRVFFHERAAIAEFDGGLPRAEAEERAYACCVVEWLNQNPTTSTSGRCLACGAERDLAIRCCRSEPTQSAMPGYIASVSRRGIGRERPTRSRHLLRSCLAALTRNHSAPDIAPGNNAELQAAVAQRAPAGASTKEVRAFQIKRDGRRRFQSSSRSALA